MRLSHTRTWCECLFLLGTMWLGVGQAWPYSSGPPNGLTGAPGELTCALCHGDGSLNTGGGRFRLFPAERLYAPGDTLTVTVAIEQLGQRRWGFELTAVDHDGQSAGTLLVTDAARTQVARGLDGRQYLKHTGTGTDEGVLDRAPGWAFQWIAPPAGTGSLTFYATGNAANGDGQRGLGDYVYTALLTLGEFVAVEPVSWTAVKNLFR